jgi:hypothetical protein
MENIGNLSAVATVLRRPTGTTPGNVKRLLPPRQSRGNSLPISPAYQNKERTSINHEACGSIAKDNETSRSITNDRETSRSIAKEKEA